MTRLLEIHISFSTSVLVMNAHFCWTVTLIFIIVDNCNSNSRFFKQQSFWSNAFETWRGSRRHVERCYWKSSVLLKFPDCANSTVSLATWVNALHVSGFREDDPYSSRHDYQFSHRWTLSFGTVPRSKDFWYLRYNIHDFHLGNSIK